MRMTTPFSLILTGFTLTLALACGGGSGSSASAPAPTATTATGLAYVDPTSGDWRLMKDAASTPNRLILNLVGPAGFKSRGVGFNLVAPAGVKFKTFDNGLPINDLNVYELRAVGSHDPVEPLALTGGLLPGNKLSVGVYQKDRDRSAKDSGVPLCQIALALDTTQTLTSGTPFQLSIPKAKAIPEDIGLLTDPLPVLAQKMKMVDISISVGTLSAK
ncbi:MAG TPA: hypothetical protein VJ623_04150 [Holophagaceae bacterium]|nr:hypothetical protein [Holophagaceae bacterium]